MSEFIKVLGSKIRELRKSKQLTQVELGEKMQTSQSYIGEIERGQVNVSMETLEKVAHALDITLYDLFDFSEVNLNEQSFEKHTVIEVHKRLLHERNLNEVKMIHQITKEIVRTIDQNK